MRVSQVKVCAHKQNPLSTAKRIASESIPKGRAKRSQTEIGAHQKDNDVHFGSHSYYHQKFSQKGNLYATVTSQQQSDSNCRDTEKEHGKPRSKDAIKQIPGSHPPNQQRCFNNGNGYCRTLGVDAAICQKFRQVKNTREQARAREKESTKE